MLSIFLQISSLFLSNRCKLVDRLITLTFMIPKVNLGVGEMGFMVCDL